MNAPSLMLSNTTNLIKLIKNDSAPLSLLKNGVNFKKQEAGLNSSSELNNYKNWNSWNGWQSSLNKTALNLNFKGKIKSPNFAFTNTQENRIKDYAEAFNLNEAEVRKAAMKAAAMLKIYAATAENNVNGVIEKYGKYLTKEDYLKACLKLPTLFCMSSETVQGNIDNLVKKFKKEGLTLEDYIKASLKQPPLFAQAPDLIEDHIKALLFINKNNLADRLVRLDNSAKFNRKDVMKKALEHPLFISCRNELNYSYLLRRKMFPNGNPAGVEGYGKVNEKLSYYLKHHPKAKFKFSVIRDDYGKAEEFVKYANNLALQALNRDDVFEIKVRG